MKLRLPHKFQAALMAALASVSFTTLSSGSSAQAWTLDDAVLKMYDFTQASVDGASADGWTFTNTVANTDGVFTTTSSTTNTAIKHPDNWAGLIGSNRVPWAGVITINVNDLPDDIASGVILNCSNADGTSNGMGVGYTMSSGTVNYTGFNDLARWNDNRNQDITNLAQYADANGLVTVGVFYTATGGMNKYVEDQFKTSEGLRSTSTTQNPAMRLSNTAGVAYTNLYVFAPNSDTAISQADMQGLMQAAGAYYWNGSTDATWSTTSTNWNHYGSSVGVSTGAGNAHTNVVFGADAVKNVAVADSITVGDMTVEGNYTFNMQTGGSLTAGTVTIASGASLSTTGTGGEVTIASLAGAGALNKGDGGTMTLGSAITNTFTGAINVTGGTLNLGNFRHTLSNITVSGGGVVTTSSGNSTGCVSGNITINPGGTFRVTGSNDAFGWGENATKNIILTGEAGNLAKLELNQTGGSTTMTTNIEMHGYSSITSYKSSGATEGDSFNTYGGSITVTGTHNTIQRMQMRSAVTVTVDNAAELTINNLVDGNGDSTRNFTKAGAGALTVDTCTATFNNLTVSGGSMTTTGGNFIINNEFNVTGSGTEVTFGGKVTMKRNARTGFNASGSVVTFAGGMDFTGNGGTGYAFTVGSGATLKFGGTSTVRSTGGTLLAIGQDGGSTVELLENATLTLGNLYNSSVLSGNGVVTLASGSTLNVAGLSSTNLTNNGTINATGQVWIGALSGTGTLRTTGSLVYDSASSSTYAGVLSSPTIQIKGGGALAVTGGIGSGTTLTEGSLSVGAAGGAVSFNGTITNSGSGTVTLAGNGSIADIGSFNVVDPGTGIQYTGDDDQDENYHGSGYVKGSTEKYALVNTTGSGTLVVDSSFTLANTTRTTLEGYDENDYIFTYQLENPDYSTYYVNHNTLTYSNDKMGAASVLRIADGATLVAGEAPASAKEMAGAGIYRLATNTNTLAGTVTLGADWTGSVEVSGSVGGPTCSFNSLSTDHSNVLMSGAKFWWNGQNPQAANFRLEAKDNGSASENTAAMQVMDGSEGRTYTFSGAFSGTGDFAFTKTNYAIKPTFKFQGDLSQWTGDIVNYNTGNAVTYQIDRSGDNTFNGGFVQRATGTMDVKLGNTDASTATVTGAVEVHSGTMRFRLHNGSAQVVNLTGGVTMDNGTILSAYYNTYNGTEIFNVGNVTMTGATATIGASDGGHGGIINITGVTGSGTLNLESAASSSARSLISLGTASDPQTPTFSGNIDMKLTNTGGERALVTVLKGEYTAASSVVEFGVSGTGTNRVIAMGIDSSNVRVLGLNDMSISGGTTAGQLDSNGIFSGSGSSLNRNAKGITTTYLDHASDDTVRTLTITGTDEYSTSIRVLENVSLAMNGTGTQTFSGDMSAFNGSLTVNNGTLKITGANGISAAYISGDSGVGTLEVTNTLTLNGEPGSFPQYYTYAGALKAGGLHVVSGTHKISGISGLSSSIQVDDAGALELGAGTYDLTGLEITKTGEVVPPTENGYATYDGTVDFIDCYGQGYYMKQDNLVFKYGAATAQTAALDDSTGVVTFAGVKDYTYYYVNQSASYDAAAMGQTTTGYIVAGGATFTAAGTNLAGKELVLGQGSTWETSSGGNFDAQQVQTLTLQGDATVTANANASIAGTSATGATSMSLGGHTLQVEGNGSHFALFNTTATDAGTIQVNNNGWLQVGHSGKTSSATMKDVVVNIANGGHLTLDKNSTITVEGLTGSGTIQHDTGATGNATIIIEADRGDYTFSGSMTAGKNVTMAAASTGTQTLALSGNTSLGTVAVNGGTLNLSSTDTLTADTVTVEANGTLGLGGMLSVTNALTMAAGATFTTTGTLTLNGTQNVLSGATVGAGGTLNINGNSTLLASIANESQVTFTSDVTVTMDAGMVQDGAEGYLDTGDAFTGDGNGFKTTRVGKFVTVITGPGSVTANNIVVNAGSDVLYLNNRGVAFAQQATEDVTYDTYYQKSGVANLSDIIAKAGGNTVYTVQVGANTQLNLNGYVETINSIGGTGVQNCPIINLQDGAKVSSVVTQSTMTAVVGDLNINGTDTPDLQGNATQLLMNSSNFLAVVGNVNVDNKVRFVKAGDEGVVQVTSIDSQQGAQYTLDKATMMVASDKIQKVAEGDVVLANHTSSRVVDNTEAAGSFTLSSASLAMQALEEVHAVTGDISFLNTSAVGEYEPTLKVLEIANGKTVSFSKGATIGDVATEATVTVAGTLTAGEGATLNANLVMGSGSTLDVSATAGAGLLMGSTVTLNPGVTLSAGDMDAITGMGFMDQYTLFTGVDAFSYDGTTTPSATPIAFDSETWVKAADVFTNNDFGDKDYYLFYGGAGNGSNVGSIYIMQMPEPTTGTLSLLALAALAARRRRKD